jgi:hypothetical protein
MGKENEQKFWIATVIYVKGSLHKIMTRSVWERLEVLLLSEKLIKREQKKLVEISQCKNLLIQHL